MVIAYIDSTRLMRRSILGAHATDPVVRRQQPRGAARRPSPRRIEPQPVRIVRLSDR